MNNHVYRLQYKVTAKPEGLTADEATKGLETDGLGACDALFYASIMYPEDGSLSILFDGLDGRTGAVLDDREWWKVWVFLAQRLGMSKTLDENRKAICRDVFETVMEALREAREPVKH